MCVWVRVHIPLIPLHILFRGGGRFDPLCLMKVLQRGCRIWSLMKISSGRTSRRERMCSIIYVQFTSVPCVAAIPIWVILLLQILVLVQINIQCGYGSKSKTQQAKEPNTYLFIFVYMNSPFPHFSYVDLFGGSWKHMFMTLANEGPDETHEPLLQEGLYNIYIHTAGSDGSSSNHQPSSTYDPARSASLPSPTPCCPSCESISSKKRMEGTRARAWKDSGFWSCEFSEWPSGNPTLESETQGKSVFFPLFWMGTWK